MIPNISMPSSTIVVKLYKRESLSMGSPTISIPTAPPTKIAPAITKATRVGFGRDKRTGFGNVSYFSKVFEETNGINPKSYML